ncbi:MAG: hypothetical protein M3539_14210, partial [Acidobacteriota bacterium]|nr:hypothetical protein [Acidobacteriota bacterium]
LERITLEQGSPHSEAGCTYCIIQDDEGKSLQVDTYGSAQQKMLDKKSQSIRFSPEAIAQLREILAKEL